MRRIAKLSRNIKVAAWIIFGFMTAFYVYLAFFSLLGQVYHGFINTYGVFTVIRFTLVGFLVGSLVAVVDVSLLSRLTRNLNFLLTLLVNTAAYVALSLLALLLFVSGEELFFFHSAGSFSLESRLRNFFADEFLILLLYLPFVGLVLNAFRLVVQRVGVRNFWNAVSGRYHVPHEEERVFMFLDMYRSTAIAEEIGHEEYHNLLYDVFNDIAEPVAMYGGEVYQYVGDSVVLTWSIPDGTRQMNCVNCCFDILERIADKAAEYEKRYRHVPQFKAGLHAGKVTAGEVGDEKIEIVFHGDTVNTAARIQGECEALGETILLSEELLFLFPVRLLKNYRTRFKGTIPLKGRVSRISLYSIDKLSRALSQVKKA